MTCSWVSSRLAGYLDGELNSSESRAIRTHLHDCDGCRAEFEAYEQVKRCLAETAACEPPDGFEERLVSTVFAHESAPARRRLTLVWAGCLAFAIAFAGASVWLRSGRERQIEAGEQIARSNFELARDQAYSDGADPFYGPTAVLTTSHGRF